MGRRERAMTKPLRISRDVHIFQLPDMVKAPAEGAGSREILLSIFTMERFFQGYKKILIFPYP